MIKKRTKKSALLPTTYADYRAQAWGVQDTTLVDFGNSSMIDGSKLIGVFLQPKRTLFYKDTWHCESTRVARVLLGQLIAFDDITWVELSYRHLRVDYSLAAGASHELPGQETEDRSKVYG